MLREPLPNNILVFLSYQAHFKDSNNNNSRNIELQVKARGFVSLGSILSEPPPEHARCGIPVNDIGGIVTMFH